MVKKLLSKLREWTKPEGNPNVVWKGFGDILYCEECKEVVETVHHECEEPRLPKTVRFENERKKENKFRKQYLRRVGDTWCIVINEVSSFEPNELEAIAKHMRKTNEEIP